MKLKPLMLLASSVLLASCANANNPADSLAAVTIDPSSSETSEAATSNQIDNETLSGSVSIEHPAAWTEDDLEDMAYYIGDNVIPFPTGITSNYETDTDLYGEAFLVYDEDCGDLVDAYEELLLADGYTYSEDDSDEDEGYYTYIKDLENGDDLFVQTDYIDGYFEVFAWLETPIESYATFPYEKINEALGTSLSESNFPSFELDDEEEYYLSVYDDYVLVYGYIDSSISDDDFDEDYLAAFEDMGFTLDDEYYAATSEDLGVETYWYADSGVASLFIYTLEEE